MGAGLVTLFACGDVRPGRGIDQMLPRPGDPELREHYADANAYVRLAERANGPVPPASSGGDIGPGSGSGSGGGSGRGRGAGGGADGSGHGLGGGTGCGGRGGGGGCVRDRRWFGWFRPRRFRRYRLRRSGIVGCFTGGRYGRAGELCWHLDMIPRRLLATRRGGGCARSKRPDHGDVHAEFA